MNELKDIDQLLASKLGRERKILHIDVFKPPPKGVGSVMLKVKVKIRNDDGIEEFLYLVAKKIPTDESLKQIFDIQRTFKKEVSFYEIILPVLEDFRKEEGVPSDILGNFPKFYGARYNLNGRNEMVDEDAVLLLEDLSENGFINIDCARGFSFDQAKGVLQDLAKFQGTVIAIKLKKPQVFENKIKAFCSPFQFPKNDFMASSLKTLKELLQAFPDCAHLTKNESIFIEKDTPTKSREPFATIIHFDLWTNNILNKIENGEIVKNVFIDFQMYDYRSPAADLFFFLWTSVQMEVLELHLDELIRHYYQSLINILKSFKVATSSFNYEKFEEEICAETEYEFGHVALLLFTMKYQKNLEEVLTTDKFQITNLSPDLKNLIHLMVKICDKKGWIQKNKMLS